MSSAPSIATIFEKFQPILPDSDACESYLNDVVLSLKPEAILRPSTVEELQEILKICLTHKIPYTASASRTSVTGASVTDTGILISMEKLTKTGEIEPHALGASVWVEPGVFLKDLQKSADDLGWHYPPDPTSWEEVLIGGTLATNATGENSYHYGSSRNYVLELLVMDHQGQIRHLKRNRNPLELFSGKNRAGLFLDGEELDWHLGAEGSLGMILKARLLLIPKPAPMLSIMLFFENEDQALKAAPLLDQRRTELNLRCLEYMDARATDFMREKSTRFEVPEGVVTLYLKSELIEEDSDETFMEALCEIHSDLTNQNTDLMERAIVASEYLELLEFRRLRHHVPATINEVAHQNKAQGGGKISSDWWVPLPHLREQFTFMRETLKPFQDITATFGHLGNGHPHVNIMARNFYEKEKALEATRLCMKNAARLGGGVAGEHGLGKMKTWALPLQWPEETVRKMQKIKQDLDPDALAAPGNLFGRNP